MSGAVAGKRPALGLGMRRPPYVLWQLLEPVKRHKYNVPARCGDLPSVIHGLSPSVMGSAQSARMNPCPPARPGEGEQEQNRRGTSRSAAGAASEDWGRPILCLLEVPGQSPRTPGPKQRGLSRNDALSLARGGVTAWPRPRYLGARRLGFGGDDRRVGSVGSVTGANSARSGVAGRDQTQSVGVY
jgi:hypothetical protein